VKPCKECGGSGFLTEERDGALYARPCKCAKVEQAEKLVQSAGIPERYRCRYVFTEYRPKPQTCQEQALTLAKRYAEEYPALPSERNGLLFLGPCGVGKTHLAVAILQEVLMRKGLPVLFQDLNDLYRSIRSTYQPGSDESEYEILEPLVKVPLLLLDELGCVASAWAQDTLYYLISQRYNRERPTLFTTNFLDDPGKGETSLEDRIGTRSRSRLAEMCRTVLLDGPDHRRGGR